MKPYRVVIIGGGFGGLSAIQSFKNKPVEVTLIDKRNFHLFQPLLYQVATGGLSPGDIASPLRAVLKKYTNVQVLLGEMTDIDIQAKTIILRDGTVNYDSLIVAAGAKHSYFGHDEWEESAPGLKTIEDATEIRRKVLLAFEAAEREDDPKRRKAWLTFVIVGAGPTGVELSGAIGELANHTLKNNFRSINPADAEILLMEGSNQILPVYPADLSQKAEKQLQKLGVKIVRNTFVTAVNPNAVTIKTGDSLQRIPTKTVVWAAGVQASPIGAIIAKCTGAEIDTIGRIIVNERLSLPGHPEIFIIGDLAHTLDQNGKPLPGIAPVAMQQGTYVTKQILERLQGKESQPFRYIDRGSMAVIGRAAAVVNLPWMRFSGFFAWMVWLLVHLMMIVEFENRLLVMVQWAWSYFTRNRRARLITGQEIIQIREKRNL